MIVVVFTRSLQNQTSYQARTVIFFTLEGQSSRGIKTYGSDAMSIAMRIGSNLMK